MISTSLLIFLRFRFLYFLFKFRDWHLWAAAAAPVMRFTIIVLLFFLGEEDKV